MELGWAADKWIMAYMKHINCRWLVIWKISFQAIHCTSSIFSLNVLQRLTQVRQSVWSLVSIFRHSLTKQVKSTLQPYQFCQLISARESRRQGPSINHRLGMVLIFPKAQIIHLWTVTTEADGVNMARMTSVATWNMLWGGNRPVGKEDILTVGKKSEDNGKWTGLWWGISAGTKLHA